MAKKELSGNRDERLAKARIEMAKKFKEPMIIEPDDIGKVETVSSGSIMLDAALGGGWPRGRLIELFGKQSSGKSTIAMASCAEIIRAGGSALYLDFEHTFTPDYAESFGIDVHDPNFILAEPAYLEDGMDIADKYLEDDLVEMIVFDSVASMLPKVEAAEDFAKQTVALQARALNKAGRRLMPKFYKHKAIGLYINHEREVIGGFNPTGIARTTTPGGVALHYYTSFRVETARIGNITAQSDDLLTGKRVSTSIGTKHKAVVVKNKLSAGKDVAYFYIRKGWGLCEPQIVVELAERCGFIKRGGAYYDLGAFGRFKSLHETMTYLSGPDGEAAYTSLRAQVSGALSKEPELVEDEEDDAPKTNVLKLSQAERL